MPEGHAALAAHIEERSAVLAKTSAVVLPDLFVDHFVPLPGVAPFIADAHQIAARGGGNRPTPGQFHRLGGNAANTAYALGRLGVPTTLIARTDALGLHLLRAATRGLPVDSGHVRDVGRASTTTALEFADEDANVMLSDAGPLGAIGPDDLSDADWHAVGSADVVAVTNWSQTFGHGNELLAAVLEHADKGGATTFLDTGDPSHRGSAVADLLALPALRSHLHAWGMNTNEARLLAATLTGAAHDSTDDAVARLSAHFPGRIDLHTAQGATSIQDGTTLGHAPSFNVTPHHRTGAGDAWNAGCLLGTLLGLDHEARLATGNAVAALTLTNSALVPPDLPALTRFLQRST